VNGSELTRLERIQEILGVKVDGEWGPECVRALAEAVCEQAEKRREERPVARNFGDGKTPNAERRTPNVEWGKGKAA